jgi:hypothetical protein
MVHITEMLKLWNSETVKNQTTDFNLPSLF